MTTKQKFIQNHPSTKGLTYVIPRATELQLDLDSVKAKNEANTLMALYSSTIGGAPSELPRIVVAKWEPSSTKGHYHCTVRMSRAIETLERVLLQAIFGSDLKRELLSYVGVKLNVPDPILFYKAGKKLTKSLPDAHEGENYVPTPK